MMPEPYALTLAEAIDALSSGALSCTALTRSLLDRIDATDANVQAWAWLDREHALASAGAQDARRTSDGASMLAGVPIGVKDIVATAGMPTQMGSPIFAGAIPARDAECIVRLDRAGGMVLGKTVTTEFAFMQPGKTRNPWHAACTPGGSSSGSAAAVALGQVPAAIGTQTNGSVIRPAAYCGIVGFKPGRDAAAVRRRSSLQSDAGHAGRFRAYGRRLRVARRCPRRRAMRSRCPGWRSEAAPAVGWLPEFPWVATSSEQRDALDAAADALRACRCTRYGTLAAAEHAATHRCSYAASCCTRRCGQLGALQDRERGRMSAKLNAALDEGRTIGDDAYAEALDAARDIVAALADWLDGFDAMLTPPAPGAAPEDLTQTGDPSCCSLWSLAGLPRADRAYRARTERACRWACSCASPALREDRAACGRGSGASCGCRFAAWFESDAQRRR